MSQARGQSTSGSFVCRGRKEHLYFTGTFVPVEFLWKYLAQGHDLADFLAGFPSITRAQVVAVLEAASVALSERFLVGEHSV